MRALSATMLALGLLLAGCAGAEFDEDEFSEPPDTEGEPSVPPADDAGKPLPPGKPDAGRDAPAEGQPPTPPTTVAPPPGVMSKTDGPAGDTDADGIPDSLERSLASECTIAGLTCASLGIEPPTVGTRDLIIIQQGRSGVEQNWRFPANVWADVRSELASHGIRAQVGDIGIRDDINVSATWENASYDGRFWTAWLVYDDPAKAIREDTAGSQLYNLIRVLERDSDVEMRATALHEIYHMLLGDLRGEHSKCGDETAGGPSHSSNRSSVLYTSDACENNDGSFYRLSEAEAAELREEPFAAFTEMNAPGWPSAEFE